MPNKKTSIKQKVDDVKKTVKQKAQKKVETAKKNIKQKTQKKGNGAVKEDRLELMFTIVNRSAAPAATR